MIEQQTQQVQQAQLEALRRLVKAALRSSHQGCHVANFLLAWHDAPENGGWDPIDLRNLDQAIGDDILSVLPLAREGKYPDSLGFEREMCLIFQLWRGNIERE